MFYWAGQEMVDITNNAVVNSRLCMFDFLHQDTVHSLLTLVEPVCSYREWFVLRFSACLRDHIIIRLYVVRYDLSCVMISKTSKWKTMFHMCLLCSWLSMHLILFCFFIVKISQNADLNGVVANVSTVFPLVCFLHCIPWTTVFINGHILTPL